MANDTPTRWTLAQASVWIRTLDHAEVRRLGKRQRKCLALAAQVVKDAVQASKCLRVALERGRLRAEGRRAWRPIPVETGKLQRWTIVAAAAELIPETFWKEGDFFSSLGDDGASAPGEREGWLRVTVLAADCIRLWKHPADILPDDGMPLAHLLENHLPSELVRLDWFLSRSDVVVTGVNSRGEEVQVPRKAFERSAIEVDREQNTLKLGATIWSAVHVELARGSPLLLDQAAVDQWMHERFKTWPRDKPPPGRTEDTNDAKANFNAKGYRFTGLAKMVSIARKTKAEPWTHPGPHGRKKAEATGNKAPPGKTAPTS